MQRIDFTLKILDDKMFSCQKCCVRCAQDVTGVSLDVYNNIYLMFGCEASVANGECLQFASHLICCHLLLDTQNVGPTTKWRRSHCLNTEM